MQPGLFWVLHTELGGDPVGHVGRFYSGVWREGGRGAGDGVSWAHVLSADVLVRACIWCPGVVLLWVHVSMRSTCCRVVMLRSACCTVCMWGVLHVVHVGGLRSTCCTCCHAVCMLCMLSCRRVGVYILSCVHVSMHLVVCVCTYPCVSASIPRHFGA